MKKRIQRALCLLMAAVLMFCVVGCGGNNEDPAADVPQDAPQNTPVVSDEAEAKWTNDASKEITIMVRGEAAPNEDNMVIRKMEELTGTQINIIYVTKEDYATKLNAMIAAGDTPDIFEALTLSDVEAFKEAGLIADMSDVLKAVAPNVLEETKDILYIPSVNQDGIYMVMNASAYYNTNVCIRTDWLDNLGLEMPTDLESYAKVLHAFTYDDPDQNGVDDTFGLSFNMETFSGYNYSFSNVFGAYGIAKGRPMMIDGTVTTWAKHPNYLEAMKYIKGLIDDGVCEPDYVTIPNLSMFEKLWIGTSGVMEWECVGPTNNWYPGRYTEDPLPTFGFATLKGPYGDCGTAKNYVDCTTGWVFAADCENLEGAAKIANFCMSEEGSDLLYLGIEGVMYNWTDKEAGLTERIGEFADDAVHRAEGAFCYYGLFTPENNAAVRTFNALTQEGVRLARANEIDWAYITAASDVYMECGADMDQLIKEMNAELLNTDEADMQEVYDSYIAEWESIGGADWEKEMTELWAAQNN